ncbi:MAG: peptidase S10, partial [Gammaproteobacteria bacterium]
MKLSSLFTVLALCALVFPAIAADKPAAKAPAASAAASPASPQESTTQGSVMVEGQTIKYKAVAGTLILKDKDGKPTGSMFYVAYFKDGAK